MAAQKRVACRKTFLIRDKQTDLLITRNRVYTNYCMLLKSEFFDKALSRHCLHTDGLERAALITALQTFLHLIW